MNQEVNIEEKLNAEISDLEHEECEAKCLELQVKYNCPKVHYSIQVKTDGTFERVISYFKEPNFTDKLMLMSKVREDNQYLVADELRQIYQLREESDPLTFGDSYLCEPYKLGVVQKCLEIITIVQARAKKK